MTDPICGMNVEPERAAGSHTHNGQTYYFCSQHCLAKFRDEPEKFLMSPAPGEVGHHHEHSHGHGASPKIKSNEAEQGTYVCPMDPEVREAKPGACPKCGMALEPAAPAAPAVKTEYVCPMHPEIVRSEPGSCPICGMALEPRVVTLDEQNPELDDMTRRFLWSLVLTA
ncbi:MAG: heavy metal-binding domain-containing protein, partial [Candidatus Binatia bacterium]